MNTVSKYFILFFLFCATQESSLQMRALGPRWSSHLEKHFQKGLGQVTSADEEANTTEGGVCGSWHPCLFVYFRSPPKTLSYMRTGPCLSFLSGHLGLVGLPVTGWRGRGEVSRDPGGQGGREGSTKQPRNLHYRNRLTDIEDTLVVIWGGGGKGRGLNWEFRIQRH